MPKFKRKTPCRECPFLRDSFAGWLGVSTAKEFIGSVLLDAEMPCHTSIDYGDPDWVENQLPDADICAGAAQFLRNWMKMPRGGAMADAVRGIPAGQPRVNGGLGEEFPKVFGTPEEFLNHHDNDRNKAFVELAEKKKNDPQPSSGSNA